MNRVNEEILNTAVRRSCGYDPARVVKWSIVECAKNEYLDPGYDPFELLKFTLMAYTIRAKMGLTKE